MHMVNKDNWSDQQGPKKEERSGKKKKENWKKQAPANNLGKLYQIYIE